MSSWLTLLLNSQNRGLHIGEFLRYISRTRPRCLSSRLHSSPWISGVCQWSRSDWLTLPPPGAPLEISLFLRHTSAHILMSTTNIEKAFICKALQQPPLWDHSAEHLKIHIEEAERGGEQGREDSPPACRGSSHPGSSCLLKPTNK